MASLTHFYIGTTLTGTLYDVKDDVISFDLTLGTNYSPDTLVFDAIYPLLDSTGATVTPAELQYVIINITNELGYAENRFIGKIRDIKEYAYKYTITATSIIEDLFSKSYTHTYTALTDISSILDDAVSTFDASGNIIEWSTWTEDPPFTVMAELSPRYVGTTIGLIFEHARELVDMGYAASDNRQILYTSYNATAASYSSGTTAIFGMAGIPAESGGTQIEITEAKWSREFPDWMIETSSLYNDITVNGGNSATDTQTNATSISTNGDRPLTVYRGEITTDADCETFATGLLSHMSTTSRMRRISGMVDYDDIFANSASTDHVGPGFEYRIYYPPTGVDVYTSLYECVLHYPTFECDCLFHSSTLNLNNQGTSADSRLTTLESEQSYKDQDTNTSSSPTFVEIHGTHACEDTRATNPNPSSYCSGVRYDFKENATSDGLNDGGTYHGVQSFRPYGASTDFTGGPMYQLGYTNNANLWLRLSTGASSWGSWKRFYGTDDNVDFGTIACGAITSDDTVYTTKAISGTTGHGIKWYPSDIANSGWVVYNSVSTAGNFVPTIATYPISTDANNVYTLHASMIDATYDAGVVPAFIVRSARTSGAALTTKPVFGIQNWSTYLLKVAADGTMTCNKIIASGTISGAENQMFSAFRSSTDTLSDATEETVKFNSEKYDTGSDYDTSTGAFTAPYAGKYQFNVQVMINNLPSGGYVRVRLYIGANEAAQTIAWNHGAGAYDTSANLNVILNLSASDVVKVTAYTASGDVTYEYDASVLKTFFQAQYLGT